MKFFSSFIVAAVCAVAASTASADNVTFTYQGRVNANGSPYTGSGQFKFAILNNAENKTLWTNDGTVIGEPAAAVSLPVQNGVFSVAIGDPSAGMTPINSSIFSSRRPLKLRIWVNCAGSGFEQLSPDQRLVDLTLNTVSSGEIDYTIYVNGTTGDNANNGLTTETAKRTIQGGVDIVPPMLRCNVSVKVAPGDYKEAVQVSGISASGTAYIDSFDGNFLKIVGDETWTAATAGSPNVRIMGADSDATTAPRLRRTCMTASNCSAVMFQGLCFDLAGSIGAKVESGSYVFKSCRATRCLFSGLYTGIGAFGNFVDSAASLNGHGYSSGAGSQMNMTGDAATTNTYHGVNAIGPYNVTLYGGNNFSGNSWSGASFSDGAVAVWGGTGSSVRSNAFYGIETIYRGSSRGQSSVTNTGNGLGTTSDNPGGTFY